MASGINNFNSIIINQTVGNVHGGDSREDALQSLQGKLDEIEKRIRQDIAKEQSEKLDSVLMAVMALQTELSKEKPNKALVERWFGNLSNVASVVSLVDAAHPFLKTLFA